MKPLYATSRKQRARYSKEDYKHDLLTGAKAFGGTSALAFMAGLGYYALPTIVAPILL